MHGIGRKVFDPNVLKCVYCKKRGHTLVFCPAAPATEAHDLPTEVRKFANSLIESPQVPLEKTYGHMKWEEARTKAETLGAEYNKGNPWAKSTLARDALRRSLGHWKAIGCNKNILSWIAFGLPIRLHSEPPHIILSNHPSYFQHIDFIDAEVKQHLADGSFVELTHTKVRVCNPLQVEPKKGNKLRMCMDARYINAFLAPPKFKLESLEKTLPTMLLQGDLLLSTDLRKAYYAIPIDELMSPYLAFEHRGRYFAPVILPFGLSTAPFSFHKVVREPVKFLRFLGVRIMTYLDDTLWMERKERAKALHMLAQWFFPFLGFSYNEKCDWKLETQAEFLGAIIDSVLMTLALTEERRQSIRELLLEVLRNKGTIALDKLESLTGKLSSARSMMHPVPVWTRALYKDIADARKNLQFEVSLSQQARMEVDYWVETLPVLRGERIHSPEAEIELWSDTSESGFGGHILGHHVFGPLPTELIGSSSTRRELYGLLQVASAAKQLLSGKHVRVNMDSMCSVQILTKGGSRVSKDHLNEAAKQWFLFCAEQKITCTYHWVPREQNSWADVLSKVFDQHWALSQTAVQLIDKTFGPVRLLQEGKSLYNIDEKDRQTTLLCIPDFNTIPNTLATARTLRLRLCLVYPGWSGQPWWPYIQTVARATLELPPAQVTLKAANAVKPLLPRWRMFASVVDFTRD